MDEPLSGQCEKFERLEKQQNCMCIYHLVCLSGSTSLDLQSLCLVLNGSAEMIFKRILKNSFDLFTSDSFQLCFGRTAKKEKI